MTNTERHTVRGRVGDLGLSAVLVLFSVTSGFAQPSSAAAQPGVGPSKHVQLEGELEILNKDFKDRADVSYTLKTADGKRFPMHFAKEPPTHLLTGDHVQAEGDLSNNTLLLNSGPNVQTNSKTGSGSGSGSGSTTSSGPLPNTFGTQYTLVILVNFQDDAVQPYTIADAQAMYSGQVNDFFVENSYGQTSIAPTVVGWYTIPDSVTTCNTAQIATDANNAAVASGVNLSNYSRLVYAFPQNVVCAWAGTSTVGGNPSQSWVTGNQQDFHTIAHELGHAFGLWHSHFLDCGTNAAICSNGTVVDYGDQYDTMGVQQTAAGDFNAFQKERLGWLNSGASPAITTVSSSGTYTITPYEQGSGPNALKILKSTDPTTGAKTWYYLEARQAVGFDTFLSNSIYYTQNETTGALFHIGTDGDGNSNELLDMTPATPQSSGWFDSSLVVGQSFTDSTASVTFTPTAVSSTGATVQITINGSAPAPPTPSAIAVTTNQSSYLPGQTVGMTVTALSGTSPDAGVSVSVTVTSPSGRSATLTGTTGGNGVALLSYKLSKRAALGSYTVQANTTVTGASSIAGASTSFTVR
jgi:M6 family metalloprotease-like protein